MQQLAMQKYSLLTSVGALNISASIESGQPLTFYSNYKNENGAEHLDYVTQRGMIRIERRKASPDLLAYCFFGDYSQSSAAEEIQKRFALSHDMKKIYSAIKTDEFMEKAVADFYGMRVTENQPWEATLCFLVSQFNNMKRIRLIINNLIGTFGKPITADGKEVRLFPSPESLANASIKELMACGTGFRAKYLKSTARAFTKNPEYAKLHALSYTELKERLMELDGVGDKVADCILLFGYGKFEAFPIDVWIKRVVEEVYFNGRKKRIAQIHAFANKRWGPYQGYAQQYLFWNGRQNKIGVKK